MSILVERFLLVGILCCTITANCINNSAEHTAQSDSPLTSSIVEGASPLPLPTVEATMSFRGQTDYFDFFEVRYSPEQWSKSVKDTGVTLLNHQQITGCTLDLKAGAWQRGESAESGKVIIGNYLWGWGWYTELGRIFYSFTLENRPFLFEIIYDQSFSLETIEACRTEAEKVIATFRPDIAD